MTRRKLPELLAVLGLALGWGVLGAGAAAALFDTTEFAGPRVAFHYLAASSLLSALACAPPCLALWWVVRVLAGRATPSRRDATARVAVQVTAFLLPIVLFSLLYVHKLVLPHLSAGSGRGLALSVGFLIGAAGLSALLTLGIRRLAPGGGRRLAPAGWALAAAAAVTSFGGALEPRGTNAARPNILVVSIDSLRRDAFYEYLEAAGSPALRRFAADARHYTNARTTYSHSLASHASLLTGLYPPEHGAVTFKAENGSAYGSRLEPSVPTLAEVLDGEGYETIGIVANAWLGPPFGLETGFETFFNYGIPLRLGRFDLALALDTSPIGAYVRYFDSRLGRGVHPNTGLFLYWLRSRSSSRPFFAFLHYIDMHTPSDPPPAYREGCCDGPFAELSGTEVLFAVEDGLISEREMPQARAHIRNLYQAELARMDDILRPVLEELLDGGWLEDTLVFFVSDHGEDLYERADTYGKSHVYDTSGAIPFLVRVPGERGRSQHDDLVSLVDVPPTIYGFLGLPIPPVLRGVNLLAEGTLRGADDWVYLEGWDRRGNDRARALVFGDGMKWIRDGRGREEVYDLNRDPREQRDLSWDRKRADPYRRRAQQVLAQMKGGEAEAIDPEKLPADVVERLRAMGYLR